MCLGKKLHSKYVKILRLHYSFSVFKTEVAAFENKDQHIWKILNNLHTPELAALPRAAKGLQVIDSFLLESHNVMHWQLFWLEPSPLRVWSSMVGQPDGFLWTDCWLLGIAAWRTFSSILASLDNEPYIPCMIDHILYVKGAQTASNF